jgi:predicted regulator of Ras-like GTPase activity (Roadblock/LC7/MglB family)
MTFKDTLTAICTALPEAYVVTLMGRDGIAIDTVSSHQLQLDLFSYFVEMTGVFAQAVRSSEQLQTGHVSELVIKTDKVATVLRPVGTEYFLALALPPNGNTGKARYLLRINAPKVQQELGA